MSPMPIFLSVKAHLSPNVEPIPTHFFCRTNGKPSLAQIGLHKPMPSKPNSWSLSSFPSCFAFHAQWSALQTRRQSQQPQVFPIHVVFSIWPHISTPARSLEPHKHLLLSTPSRMPPSCRSLLHASNSSSSLSCYHAKDAFHQPATSSVAWPSPRTAEACHQPANGSLKHVTNLQTARQLEARHSPTNGATQAEACHKSAEACHPQTMLPRF